MLRFDTSCIFQEAYQGINYLILQNRRQTRWRTIKVDHVLKFFSFYFFIPLSQQYYRGIASHFGKSPYFDVKFSYLDDFLKVLVFSRGGRSCWMWPWDMPGSDSGARPGWNCGSSSLYSSHKTSSYCDEKALGTVSLTCQKFQDFHFAGFSMGLWAHRNS